jgi:hypothetical protein
MAWRLVPLPGPDSPGQAVLRRARSGKARWRTVGEADPMSIEWLLSGDAAVRWQVMRDLLGEPADVVAGERARVATTGWGARLLAHQDPKGTWAHALYSPKWTSTTYTLLLLRQLGLPTDDPRAHAGCEVLLDGARYRDGGLTFAKTVPEPETCITAMVVALAATFGTVDDRVEAALSWLLDQQLVDGGWNCETVRSGSRHGSFHTTIQTLERCTPGRSGQALTGRSRRPPLAAGSSSRSTGCTARTARESSWTRASPAWCSRRGGITISCAGWTTSRPRERRGIRGWLMRSPRFDPSGERTTRGPPTLRTPAATGSASNRPVDPAASTRSEHSGSCGGGRRRATSPRRSNARPRHARPGRRPRYLRWAACFETPRCVAISAHVNPATRARRTAVSCWRSAIL